jgi:SNF2 family DNA or RNA helicase
VCNVSLVGQWIDEAKSKLKDPGLVYSYHGHNRNRDPMVLAKNGVVVTTYAILASDANHHAQKSKDPDYCAPCEQVRWWRIICDGKCTKLNLARSRNRKRFLFMLKLNVPLFRIAFYSRYEHQELQSLETAHCCE